MGNNKIFIIKIYSKFIKRNNNIELNEISIILQSREDFVY